MEEKDRLTEEEVKALLEEKEETGGILKKEGQATPSPSPTVLSHQVKAVQFAQLNPIGVSSSSEIELLSNISGVASGQLGETRMSFKEVLEMQVGDIIKLNRLVGEDIDFLINDKLVAKGTAIVTDDEKLGVRITEIVT